VFTEEDEWCVWPAEGRLVGRSAASGRLVDGDGGSGSVERGSGRGLSFVVPVGVQVKEREDRLLEKGRGSLVPGLVLKMSENGGMVMAGLVVCGGELWLVPAE